MHLSQRAAVGAVLIALACAHSSHAADIDAGTEQALVKVGDVAPDELGTDFHDKRVALSDYRGKVVVVSFWASWCAPCRKEIGVLDALQKAGGDQLQIVAVNDNENDETWNQFRRLLKDAHIKITHDVTKTVTKTFGIHAIPHMFIVDRTGHVARIHKGYSEKQFDQLIDSINAVLAQR